ncbi:Asp-tRNA(Asn)/Glu-tRNA(Gln) amidotransferase subunit GatC [Alicyclobacillus vulcanalis]|uniref:Aspartyl/glutamyl-tRNA(Asn/Gln) amidotransferase subunit C n=1 Tax=Alicyclobacillus vulcanalis TaxID=252246 RepID=A0A1N7P0D8_9BACL|nr:Asp-tRNA(Asn)/Glu-tRNA(Gln) amidotransferase subunit GatC [Alicyclobacillus vulcanalis]SIT04052.1 aspartyl/glutamyl-tRNA(Asn/Gln) amidotransferase subunit C [Alicyclobacillus vulcanalis]
MKITDETVSHVAKLARLWLDPQELAQLVPQLNDILEYAAQLQSVPMDGVEPTSHPFHEANVVRADVPRESLARDEALRNAPDQDQCMVRVPAVLEGGGGA